MVSQLSGVNQDKVSEQVSCLHKTFSSWVSQLQQTTELAQYVNDSPGKILHALMLKGKYLGSYVSVDIVHLSEPWQRPVERYVWYVTAF